MGKDHILAFALITTALIIIIGLREKAGDMTRATSRWRHAWRARMRVRVTRFAQTSWSRLYQANISGRSSRRPRSIPSRPVTSTRVAIVLSAGRAHACVSDTRGCTHYACSPTAASRAAPGKLQRDAGYLALRCDRYEACPSFSSASELSYPSIFRWAKIPHFVSLYGALRKRYE